jgi:hypothetical protein
VPVLLAANGLWGLGGGGAYLCHCIQQISCCFRPKGLFSCRHRFGGVILDFWPYVSGASKWTSRLWYPETDWLESLTVLTNYTEVTGRSLMDIFPLPLPLAVKIFPPAYLPIFPPSRLTFHFTSVATSSLGWLTDYKELDLSRLESRKGKASQSVDVPSVWPRYKRFRHTKWATNCCAECFTVWLIDLDCYYVTRFTR